MSNTTFEPGKSYRTRDDVRLECLRLAFARAGANDPRPWRAIAEELYGWVAADAAPTPPAPVDDAYAAAWRAGAEAMREAAAQWLDRNVNGMASAMLSATFTPVPPAPPPPAAPAPEPERLSGWVNVYEGAKLGGVKYPTKAEADRWALPGRIACIDLSQHRKGEGL